MKNEEVPKLRSFLSFKGKFVSRTDFKILWLIGFLFLPSLTYICFFGCSLAISYSFILLLLSPFGWIGLPFAIPSQLLISYIFARILISIKDKRNIKSKKFIGTIFIIFVLVIGSYMAYVILDDYILTKKIRADSDRLYDLAMQTENSSICEEDLQSYWDREDDRERKWYRVSAKCYHDLAPILLNESFCEYEYYQYRDYPGLNEETTRLCIEEVRRAKGGTY